MDGPMTLVSIEKQSFPTPTRVGPALRQAQNSNASTNQAACWRIVVLPPKIPARSEAGSDAGGVRIRHDRPHAVKAPKLPLSWSSEVGFHKRVSDDLATVTPWGGSSATINLAPLHEAHLPARTKPAPKVQEKPERSETVKASKRQDSLQTVRAPKLSAPEMGAVNSIAVQNKIAAGLQPSLGKFNSTADNQKSKVEDRSKTSAGTKRNEQSGGERIIRETGDYKKLLTEAAHDIRSPIVTASQILRTISNRVRKNPQLSQSEVELLDQANLRLVQANDWAEGILLNRRLEQGRPLPVRKRFYPMQLQTSIRPLLESIASRRAVNLAWNGWERSLPKLYLDANHLSRVMMNLVSNAVDASLKGQLVSINVDWKKTICQPLQISVADQAGGISPELMQQINSSRFGDAESPAGRGLGLKTTKSLVASMAGTISAHRREPRGSIFKVALPIDNPMSIVRSWLTRNTLRAHEHDNSVVQNVFVTIDLVRVSVLDLDFVDSQLQLGAFENELPYRVARDRWLWLAMRAENQAMPYSLTRTAKRLNDLHGPASDVCRILQVFKTAEFRPSDLQGPKLQTGRMLSMIDAIVTKVAQLIGENVPITDQLAAVDRPVMQRPAGKQEGAFLRIDGQDQRRPNLALLGNPTSVQASDELADALKQLAEHWHKTQAKLDRSESQRPTMFAGTKHPVELRPKAKDMGKRTPS